MKVTPEMRINDLADYYGHDVKVLLINGKTIIGFFCNLTWAEDNVPEKDEITLVGDNIPRTSVLLEEIDTIDFLEI
jgi:hypothetical protein